LLCTICLTNFICPGFINLGIKGKEIKLSLLKKHHNKLQPCTIEILFHTARVVHNFETLGVHFIRFLKQISEYITSQLTKSSATYYIIILLLNKNLSKILWFITRGISWYVSQWQITMFSPTLTSSKCQLRLMNFRLICFTYSSYASISDFIFCSYKVM
jgi:hypothetical protein